MFLFVHAELHVAASVMRYINKYVTLPRQPIYCIYRHMRAKNSINCAIRRHISPREIWTQFNFLAQKRISLHFTYLPPRYLFTRLNYRAKKKNYQPRFTCAFRLWINCPAIQREDNFSVLTRAYIEQRIYRVALFSHINLYRALVHGFRASYRLSPITHFAHSIDTVLLFYDMKNQ